MKLLTSLFALTVLFAAAANAAPPAHVKASLISDASAIRPSKTFTVGVLLEIEPGWHIYWTNPGDTGLATTVKFKLPDGFTVTPNPFPVPQRFEQAPGEVVYGYENAVLITATVTPPPEMHIGDEVPIEASTSWLVCKQECMPGKASTSLTMKVADHADPANVMAFDRFTSVVTPISQHSPDVADVKATLDHDTHIATLLVHWKIPVSGVELFPGAEDAVTVSKITVKKAENDLTPITLKIEPVAGQTPAGDRLTVLIGYHDAEGRVRGFETTVPLK